MSGSRAANADLRPAKPMINLRIGTRLVGGFLAIVLLICAVGLIGLSGLRKVSAHYRLALEAYDTRVSTALELKAGVQEQVRAQKNYLLRGDPSYLRQIEQQARYIYLLRGRLESAGADRRDRELLRRLTAEQRILEQAFQQSVTLRQQQGVKAADRVVKGKAAAVILILDQIASHARQRALQQQAAAQQHSNHTHLLTLALSAFSALFALLLGLTLALSVTRPLKRLRSQMETIAAGGPTPDAPAVRGRDEVAQIARAFHQMVQQAGLLREMEARSKRLEALSTRVARAQEEERGRIARELHDGLGQALTAIKLNLRTASKSLADEAGAREKLARVERLADESLDELRRLAFDLHPPALDTLGLAAALISYARSFKEHSGLAVTVEAEESDSRLPLEVEIALYRISQEALTNISKHSRASQAIVRLERERDGVALVIKDNGVGFDAGRPAQGDSVPGGLGLLSMERRAEELGGRCRIISQPGQGTTIIVTVPQEVEKRHETDNYSVGG